MLLKTAAFSRVETLTAWKYEELPFFWGTNNFSKFMQSKVMSYLKPVPHTLCSEFLGRFISVKEVRKQDKATKLPHMDYNKHEKYVLVWVTPYKNEINRIWFIFFTICWILRIFEKNKLFGANLSIMLKVAFWTKSSGQNIITFSEMHGKGKFNNKKWP